MKLSWEEIRSLHAKTVLYQEVKFSISMQFSSFLAIYRTLSGASTPG